MATVALGIVADNTVLFTFGKEPRGFQMPWATASFEVAGIPRFSAAARRFRSSDSCSPPR